MSSISSANPNFVSSVIASSTTMPSQLKKAIEWQTNLEKEIAEEASISNKTTVAISTDISDALPFAERDSFVANQKSSVISYHSMVLSHSIQVSLFFYARKHLWHHKPPLSYNVELNQEKALMSLRLVLPYDIHFKNIRMKSQ